VVNSGPRWGRWIIIPLAILLTGIALFVLYLKRRKTQKEERDSLITSTERLIENGIHLIPKVITLHEQDAVESIPEELTKEFLRPRTNAIWVLGKFNIFDNKGRNISHLCSNKIKSLFFLILLSSLYDEGISSDELSDILWPGMDKTRTKNNRSVTMNHLRKIFDDMDGIGLIHENRNWKVSFDPKVYIDLVELNSRLGNKESNAAAIMGMYAMGNLLPDEKVPELDKYKGNFETQAIELLIHYGYKYLDGQKYATCYEIAAIIHNRYDELNEKALNIKLTALNKLRNHNKARQEYDNFCQRFKLLMDVDFTVPFNDLTEIIE
jgi:two-component SAPR family response regulator